MKTPKFKSRYVLGEGYPWALGKEAPYTGICLCQKRHTNQWVEITFPNELWSEKLPKYRLVLERVKERKP